MRQSPHERKAAAHHHPSYQARGSEPRARALCRRNPRSATVLRHHTLLLDGRDYVALYLWHEDGTFDSATVEQIAQRGEDSALPGNTLPPEAYQGGIEKMLATLGELTYGDIVVAPFEKEIDGVTFGLVANPPDEDDEWAVTAEPGNYMCWFAPWDGEYDT